MGFKVV